MPCYNCGVSQLETLAQTPTLSPSPPSPYLKYLGLSFYPLDFVYLIPKDNSYLYDIGQIISIPNSEEVEVLEYMRLDQHQRPFGEVGTIFNLQGIHLINCTRLFSFHLLRSQQGQPRGWRGSAGLKATTLCQRMNTLPGVLSQITMLFMVQTSSTV